MKIKSKRKIILSILIPLTILIAVFFTAFELFSAQYNYNLAKKLPISKTTKTWAFWYSLDEDKLEKLKKSGKIAFFASDADGKTATLSNHEYRYSISFNENVGKSSDFLRIYVYPINDAEGSFILWFNTNGSVVGKINNHSELNKLQIDQLTKKGLKLYNQFVEDYESI